MLYRIGVLMPMLVATASATRSLVSPSQTADGWHGLTLLFNAAAEQTCPRVRLAERRSVKPLDWKCNKTRRALLEESSQGEARP